MENTVFDVCGKKFSYGLMPSTTILLQQSYHRAFNILEQGHPCFSRGMPLVNSELWCWMLCLSPIGIWAVPVHVCKGVAYNEPDQPSTADAKLFDLFLNFFFVWNEELESNLNILPFFSCLDCHKPQGFLTDAHLSLSQNSTSLYIFILLYNVLGNPYAVVVVTR